jgi:Fe-S cluster assembly scaffold protein SufB
MVDNSIEGVEILPLQEAITKFKVISEKFGSVFERLDKKFNPSPSGGYLIWIKKNTKVEFPIQTCFYLTEDKLTQFPHNLIYLEEGSMVEIINLCGDCGLGISGVHAGCTEIILEPNSTLKYTQIHNWNPNIKVLPMSGAILEDNANFTSNFISLEPVLLSKMCPSTILNGDNSSAQCKSFVYNSQNAVQDIGARLIFEGKNTRGTIISKTVSESGEFTSRGILEAFHTPCVGHLECHGLILSDYAKLKAVPELSSSSKNSSLTHEASIGNLKNEKIEYLQSRGLDLKQAISLLILEFLDLDELNLPLEIDFSQNFIDKLALISDIN